jgi:tetratricopeptide (TPR) repeat protein/DNA-binding SARP family transcriptional activator
MAFGHVAGGVWVEIRLLGNVEIHSDTGVVRPRRSGERCVLAVLALHVQAPVTVTTLVDHLWSGTEQSDKSIDTVGSYLRRIRAGIKQAGGRADWLRYDRAARSYVLDIDPARVDYRRFTAMTALARRNNDPEVLRDALGLWRGPALADITGHWADHRRHTLEAERLAAYEDLLHRQLAIGQYAEVVRTVTDLVEGSTPTDRLLLLGAQGLAGRGQHITIRAWVTRVTQRMRDTVDAAPSADVLDEIERLIAHPIRWPPPPAGGISTAMFSMRADIPTFTGRDDELRGLLDAVQATIEGPPRAIAIHAVNGMAGVGKTVLSVHAAHRFADRFPDGNLFLELYGHTPGQASVPPGAALDSLLRAAGVDPTAIPPKLEDRARLWRDRMAGKKILLVLDDAADEEQVRPLLPGTAGSLVLITTRRRLPALDGVLPLTLDVLPHAQAVALLVRLAGLETERHDEHAVAEIVARCGYLPLAITLAGAQLRNHPRWTARYLADLLATEHDRLENLQAGDRSVAAAFSMSFRHLPVEQQHLFRLLGVHPGPEIDAHAAAALADGSLREVRRWLVALHTNHLIQESAPDRYQLHDLVRAYARTLAADLEPGDQQHALHRVLSYYCHIVQTASTQLPALHTARIVPVATAPTDMPRMDTAAEAQAWLTAELPTLTACIQLAAAGADEQQAIHLAAALHSFLQLNDYNEQALHIHQTALTAAVTVGDQLAQANALADVGRAKVCRREFEAAVHDLTYALDLFTELGDRLGQANVLNNLGQAQHRQGELDAAVRNLTHALDLFTELGDRLGQANVRNNLGRVQYHRSEFDAAVRNLTHALDLFTELGDRLGQANVHNDLGHVQYQLGEYETAIHNHSHALDLFTALSYQSGQADSFNDLGRLQSQLGDNDTAVRNLTHALTLYTTLGDRMGQANVLDDLGRVQHELGDDDTAVHNLTRALHSYTAMGVRMGQANVLTNLGRVRHHHCDYETATHNFTRSLELYTALGDRDGVAETLNNLGDLTLDYPDAGDPHAYFSRALMIARDIGTTVREAHALAGQARCLLRIADTNQAIALLREAHSLYQSLGVPQATQIENMLSTLENHRTAAES